MICFKYENSIFYVYHIILYIISVVKKKYTTVLWRLNENTSYNRNRCLNSSARAVVFLKYSQLIKVNFKLYNVNDSFEIEAYLKHDC